MKYQTAGEKLQYFANYNWYCHWK